MQYVSECIIIKVEKEVHALTLDKGKVGKMIKYFKITGCDNGKPIEPYGVETYGTSPIIIIYGLYQDSVRYYEPITKEEYQKLTNKL